MVSAQLFCMTLAGTLSTFISGALATYFNAAANPIVYGKILAFMTCVAEFLSIPFFWLAGKAYIEHLEKEKETL